MIYPKNFTYKEFTCPCGCGFNCTSKRLVMALQDLRNLIGKPIIINSACRCEKHNAEVGGVQKKADGSGGSLHMKGIAADIRVEGLSPKALALEAEKIFAFNNGGIGIYRTFVHVDVRGHKARWNG